MHNLTYQERARFAYAAGNTELAEALEKCAEQEAIIERLDELNADLLDVAYEVLPYIEAAAENDERQSRNALRNIQAVIKAVEES